MEKKPEVRTLTKVERAWLAGVIDGEGSVGLYNYGSQGRRAQISMGNTVPAFVARMREIIGCGSSVMRINFGPKHHGRKPMYLYTLKGSARCYKILRQILPYLIIKRDKASSIIAELESKPFDGRNNQQRYRGRTA